MAIDEATDFAGTFGMGESVSFAGRKWNVQYLDVNDLIYLQRQLVVTQPDGGVKRGIEAFDDNDMEHIRLFFYLLLRKSDPNLSEDDLDNQRYKLTEGAVGRMLTIPVIKSPETKAFMNRVLIGSGLAADPNEESPKNE